MRVRFSKLAVFKLEALTGYLKSAWSEQSSLKFINVLNTKIDAIKANPLIYPESQNVPGLRKCVVTRHTTLFYEVRNETIYVLNIIDSRQDPKKSYAEVRK